SRVSFAHEAPSRRAAHEAFFRCPIRYGADGDALAIPTDVADKPNRLGDQGVSAFLDAHLDDELNQLATDDDWDGRIRAQIAEALSDGPPSIAEVARRLGVSTRTLQRRLSENGVAFQILRDGARRDLAETLLRKTQYGLSEVAFLTGFSEQSSFNRAFKRWNGQTPAAFRQAVTL
ncbi:MAG: helix-turn-helix domain-containing protein, partial [Pseudomonadota bacterium]